MKSIFLIIASILFTINTFSQESQQEYLIGEWTVKKVQIIAEFELDEQQAMMLEEISKGFINTKFTFKKDKSFLFEHSESQSEFIKELEFINNKKWKFDNDNGLIAIGTESDNFSLMGIYLRRKEGKNFFILDESPLLLEVTKK